MFENVTEYDKRAVWAMTRVFTRRVWRKRYLLRKCFLVGMGLLGTLCGLLLLILFRGLDLGERAICITVLAVCIPAFLKGLFLRRFMAWSTVRTLRRAGGSPERRFIFSGEAFRGVQSGMETAYQYEIVREVYETETYFVLHLDAQLCMMIDKGGFSQGTPDGFRALLAEKTGRAAEFVR